MVADSSRDIQKVSSTPSRITAVSISADSRVRPAPPAVPTKNMVMMAISVGNRPLQGTKLLVMMAIRRSLGESMIRHPTTPAALHPNPIAIVSACLPQALAF